MGVWYAAHLDVQKMLSEQAAHVEIWGRKGAKPEHGKI